MRLLNSAEPVLYEDVLEFGNYLGVKLPEDYVEFIVNANGEHLNQICFTIFMMKFLNKKTHQ